MKFGSWIAGRATGAFALVAACCATAVGQVPLDGFLPMIGIGLTDEFDDNFNFFPVPANGVGGNLLGPSSGPHYDVALLDTGAGFSLVTDQAYDDFNLDGPYPGESDGYRGTEFVTIGGATGQLSAPINDPFGLYAGGLQDRTGAGAALTMNNALLQGQTNTSTITLPPDSDLPNVLGLPFASQYATRIRSDSPQVFELDGKTVRTPAIDFLPLGSGGGDITRKAPLNLNPGASFTTPPGYVLNIGNFDIDNPQENPSLPTAMQGGLFLNTTVSNDGASLGNKEFFFDTGASVTVLSEFNALLLGFDVSVDEPDFTIAIVGSGGLLDNVPGFFVDQITLPALGGSITANNVPVLVLDVTDPSDAGNVVEGIVGTNLLSGRNVVIDPNPSTGGGGASAGVYISDTVTTEFTWSTTAVSAAWSNGLEWDTGQTPDYLSVARLAPTGAVDQVATVVGDQRAWDVTLGGSGGADMTIEIVSGSKLTVFSGASVAEGGVVHLQGGGLDVQYLDIRGGALTGDGYVRTGSGPIAGQVEVVSGVIAPGDGIGAIQIDGRLSLGSGAVLEFEIGGATPGLMHDQLLIDGPAALDGTLSVSLVGQFDPTVGDTFELITSEEQGGEFVTLDLPSEHQWVVVYGDDSLLLRVSVPGDFNGDAVVDAADYTTWRDGLGTTYTQADYDTWANHYGQSLPPLSAVSIPEPAAGLVLLSALAGLAVRRR